MKKTTLGLVLCALSIAFFSCEKSVPLSPEEMLVQHGTWTFDRFEIISTTPSLEASKIDELEEENNAYYQGLSFVFRGDGTGKIHQNGDDVPLSSWTISGNNNLILESQDEDQYSNSIIFIDLIVNPSAFSFVFIEDVYVDMNYENTVSITYRLHFK